MALRVNRSRACRCCGRSTARVHVVVGAPTDPHYAVAVCPACDRVDPPADGGPRVNHALTSSPPPVSR